MASRRSITPRAIPVKCDSTPSEAAIAPRRGGRPTTRGSYPTKISTKITAAATMKARSEEHTSELQSRLHLVCRLLLEKKKNYTCHSLQHVSLPCADSPYTRYRPPNVP